MVKRQYIFTITVVVTTVAAVIVSLAMPQPSYTLPAEEMGLILTAPMALPTVETAPADTPIIDLKYPIKDREGDHLTNPDPGGINLDDPSVIEKKVDYDPETGQYIITEQVGGRDVRPPVYMTFEEYLKYEREQAIHEYYQERLNSISLIENKSIIPTLYPKSKNEKNFPKIEIRPSGNIDMTLGGNWQKIDNPVLTLQARKQGGFDFNMNINMNVVGSIGDLLKVNLAYNTGASFDFENQIKLKYEGKEDDIIKIVEAGNVSFPLQTSLIQGPQSLFGVHTKLQFGRLSISNVFSQQRSQTQNLTVQNGAQTSKYEVFADQYDENRHFFLGHEFRDNYNTALSGLPNINSLANITRLEVWVTNKTGATVDVREVVAFMDLAECNRLSGTPPLTCNPTVNHADNNRNNLYSTITADPSQRSLNNIVPFLQSQGLQSAITYERSSVRKLSPSEYTYNPQLGYISLNTVLAPDDILAVAYEYTYNGVPYKVGEFAQDVPPDSAAPKVIFLKMLKGTAVLPKLPMWDLMMKNIYSIGAYQVNREDFKLELFYQDPGGGFKRYIPEGSLQGKLLIRELNMDNLNNQLDPQPDGVFDFIQGITINPSNGRIIFPLLEPFGSDLRRKFSPSEQTDIADKYVYDLLYDSTKVIAQQNPQFNRFIIRGSYKSSVTSEISLGAFNVPRGSVKVTAGGTQLVEDRDFIVDYPLGKVRIINEGVLNSGAAINVSYENNALFAFQTKTLFGTRLDYWVSDKFSLGFTHMYLKERPFTPKVNIGDDPISNNIWGLDLRYNTESSFLTWLVDKLPLYSTKEKSSFSFSAEMARLKPGHSKVIGNEGQVYIDDFEGAASTYDLRYPATSWKLASTPVDAKSTTSNDLFPEGKLISDLRFGYNRAKTAWYNIDPVFLQDVSNTPEHIADDNEQQSDPYVRQIFEQEVFPNKTQNFQGLNNNLLTFDISYYPNQRGMYNYENSANGEPGISSGLNPDGTLKEPDTRWGGIQRSLDNTNFEAANVEYIEFWLMDPFLKDSFSRGGQLYLNLGNISEDVLRDTRFFYENGLPIPGGTNQPAETEWGRVPQNPPIVNAFDNDPAARESQDVGLDGLNDDAERSFFQNFLDQTRTILNPDAQAELEADPSTDDYHYFQGDDYDQAELSILGRYKKFNGPQGNSPVQSGNTISSAATNIPDGEDLNRDNTITQAEQYYQYRIDLKPQMEIGDGFITDKLETTTPKLPNGESAPVTWYQFRIPITEFDAQIGGIQDFRSIRFMRMYLTNWDDSITLRFARLELVRNQWRRYLFSLREPGEYIPTDQSSNAFFNVTAVNIEENADRQPIPYVLPPGIAREQDLNTTQNVNALQNEQSISVQVCGLEDGDAKAIYKTINLDFRQYKRVRMFVHGESLPGQNPIKDGDLTVFIRMGADFTDNFYEYEIPLKITQPAANVEDDSIWNVANEFDFPLDSFINLKVLRNADPTNVVTSPFKVTDQRGHKYTIVGSPDLGVVKTVMLGIRNPKATGVDGIDDAQPKCAEVWFNELRLSGFEESGGWAALARMETQLADLGTVTFSTNMHTIGYGQLEQKVDQRYRDKLWQYDLAANIELGKFFPQRWGVRIPMYVGFSQSFSSPQFDPYLLDVPLEIQLSSLSGSERRAYRRKTQTYTRIKSLNFTNVRLISQNKEKKPRFWDPQNLNLTYAYTQTFKSDPLIESDILTRHRASLAYNYAPKEKSLYPFKKAIKSKSKYFDIIRDINFNPIPNSLSFSTDFNRQFGEVKVRALGDEEFGVDPTYNKYFTWDRLYGIKYNPAKSISLDFSAVNNARIDEPPGKLDTKEEKDSLWTNILGFGRTTRYQHSGSANYNLPIDKIPFLDWVQIRTGYNTTYTWTAGALYRDVNGNIGPNPLGNTIGNTNSIRYNGELNFKGIYDKWSFLKSYNSSSTKRDNKEQRGKKIDANVKKRTNIETDIAKQEKELEKVKADIAKLKTDTSADKATKLKALKKKRKEIKQKIKKLKQDKKKIVDPENPAASPFIRPLISLKRISVNYTETKSTTLPGFLPNTRFFGQDKGFNTPGLDFAFGYQPDRKRLDEFASKGWITADTNLNYQLLQSVSKNLSIKGALEPFRDFRVDLTITRTESQNYSEYFKKQFSSDVNYSHLVPITTGSYSISFINVKTLFQKVNAQGTTQAFIDFENYRSVISNRLADQNSNSQGFFENPDTAGVFLQNYRQGYGPYSQDVMIPAFIAAYTGRDVNSIKLNPFKMLPLPNWRITYNGFSKMKIFQKVFTNVVVSHAYNSTMTMSSFQSQIFFEGNGYLQPSKIDSLNNFYPQYIIPQIVISESFSPLFGLDINWKNGMTTKFDFKKTRNLSMSFVGYTLSESRTTEFTFGFGYQYKPKKPIKIGKRIKLSNAINFAADVSYRDNITINQRLDQDVNEPTSGAKTIIVSPYIDYVITKQLRAKLFFERTRTIPATSASFPITNTRAGLTLSFTLTQ
ncbi:MAG: cell surface protein SprA [Chitinophagales bacterium]|nr:cell surface protein SprA [Chitinophagales bacterium]